MIIIILIIFIGLVLFYAMGRKDKEDEIKYEKDKHDIIHDTAYLTLDLIKKYENETNN